MGMNGISYQLDSSYKKVLKDHVEARQSAIDCVMTSKHYVIANCIHEPRVFPLVTTRLVQKGCLANCMSNNAKNF
jgi:hypothetical protein